MPTSIPAPSVIPDTRLLKQPDIFDSSNLNYLPDDIDNVDDTAGFDDDNNNNYDAHAPQSITSVSDSGLRRSSRTPQPITYYHQSPLEYTSQYVRKSAESAAVLVHDERRPPR